MTYTGNDDDCAQRTYDLAPELEAVAAAVAEVEAVEDAMEDPRLLAWEHEAKANRRARLARLHASAMRVYREALERLHTRARVLVVQGHREQLEAEAERLREHAQRVAAEKVKPRPGFAEPERLAGAFNGSQRKWGGRVREVEPSAPWERKAAGL